MTPFDRAWTLLKSTLDRPSEGRGKLPRSVPYTQFDQQQTLSEFDPAFSPTFIRPRTRAELFRTHREGLLNAAEPGLYRVEEDDDVQQPDKPTHVKRHIDPEHDVLSYVLMGERGPLSRIAVMQYGLPYEMIEEQGLTQISGATHDAHRRQGHYGTLLNSIVQAGIPVFSFDRNAKSHPFHEKFQRNLPADIRPNIANEEEGFFSRGGEDPTGRLFTYQRKPMSELTPQNWGALRPMRSDFVPLRETEIRQRPLATTEQRNEAVMNDPHQQTLFTWHLNPEYEWELALNDEYRYQN